MRTSRTHHDQRLHACCRTFASKCGLPLPRSSGTLYMWAAPWCKHVYIGQTSTNGWARMRTQLYALNAGRDSGKLYDQLRKMHVSRFVFMPVCDLSIVAPVHADGLFIGAQAISLLQPSLNTRGLMPQALQNGPESHATTGGSCPGWFILRSCETSVN